jgi:anti-sigma factor RsiW
MNTNEIMQQWEDYFDGALPASERVALETAVIRDPAAQQMRAAVEQARHLRRAALESFMPAPVEADALRSAFLATLRVRAVIKWRSLRRRRLRRRSQPLAARKHRRITSSPSPILTATC